MSLLRVPFLLACCAFIGACSSNSYCLVEQDYQKAEVVPELQAVAGLEMPNSPSALRLPARPATQVPFGTRDEEGGGVCLDKPPTIALPEQPVPAGDEEPKT